MSENLIPEKPRIKAVDMVFLDSVFDMQSGYVLNFSDRTMADFFASELNIAINDEKYSTSGTSKAKRLRTFLQTEDKHIVARALRTLWDYRNAIRERIDDTDPNVVKERERFFNIVRSVEGDENIPRTDSIDKFAQDQTIWELVEAIERDVQANKPAVAMDRLHTYCMKKFAHLLTQNGISYDKNDPLNSRAGKYIKELEKKGTLTEISLRILKSSIGIFDSFNSIRNNSSFAHDNELVEKQEARFIFDSIVVILRFINGIESNKFSS
ncbi:MAG: abortive infection family protein [Chloroflexota bacterium]